MIYDQELLKRGGIVFLHDVEWPWGRRDMYYQPEMIPSEHLHSWEQKSIVQGQRELSDRGGFFPEYRKATCEGGARNGVLTAIEDFLREHKDEYEFFRVRGDFGLGIMYRRENFTEDLKFLTVRRKGIAYNVFTWPKRFAKAIYHRIGKPI